MLEKKLVLVVEDNAFLALDLSEAIEDLDGLVAGPTNRVAHALELLDNEEIVAAIVDCHLVGQDVLVLAGRLAELNGSVHCPRRNRIARRFCKPSSRGSRPSQACPAAVGDGVPAYRNGQGGCRLTFRGHFATEIRKVH